MIYKKASNKKILKCYENCRSRIPKDIPVIISEAPLPILDEILSNGETDIGSFSNQFLSAKGNETYWEDLEKIIHKQGKTLQQRFSLRKSFINNQRYSKKLGQVFDAYKYKIKKSLLEKQKENKST